MIWLSRVLTDGTLEVNLERSIYPVGQTPYKMINAFTGAIPSRNAKCHQPIVYTVSTPRHIVLLVVI